MQTNPFTLALRVFVVLWLSALAACQPRDADLKPSKPNWTSFTSANSPLPNPQINALAISRQDVVWIGTADGLARYQDSQWTLFTRANSALPSNFIQALTVQPDGTVWVGTNKGLATYDGTSWTAYTPANSRLPDRAVMSLAYDPVHSLTWVGTAKGIVSINPAQDWTVFDELDGELVLSMTTDHTGALWVGTHEPFSFRGRIKRFDKGQWTTFPLDQMGYESAFPYGMAVDNNNSVITLLAGTVVSTALRYTASGWTELSKPASVLGLRALALRDEEVWVGGSTLSQLGLPGTSPIAIPGNNTGILSMAVDAKGDLWLGSAGEGLWLYHP
jgi:ligand-binding sensor domain-containing protein